jgi:hypothetical protein
MDLLKTLKSINKEHWSTATWWIGFTIVFGTGPMWLSFLINAAFNKNNINYLIDSGQLVVFCMALISSGIYFIGREFKQTSFPGRLGFILILGVVWVITIGVVAIITICSSLPIDAGTMNWGLIRTISVVMSIISLVVVFFTAAINEWRTQIYYDVPQFAQGTGKLEEDFDKTGEKL